AARLRAVVAAFRRSLSPCPTHRRRRGGGTAPRLHRPAHPAFYGGHPPRVPQTLPSCFNRAGGTNSRTRLGNGCARKAGHRLDTSGFGRKSLGPGNSFVATRTPLGRAAFRPPAFGE